MVPRGGGLKNREMPIPIHPVIFIRIGTEIGPQFQSRIGVERNGNGGGARTHLLLALAVWPLTTRLMRDGAMVGNHFRDP